jgi:hypothetical protein
LPDIGAGGAVVPTLTPRELLLVEATAERVVELLRGAPARSGLVDAAAVADALGVSREMVYAYPAELGGKRIGAGPRGRLRFDLDQALAAWTSRSPSKESQDRESPAPARSSAHRRRGRLGSDTPLLPIKGRPITLGAEGGPG